MVKIAEKEGQRVQFAFWGESENNLTEQKQKG